MAGWPPKRAAAFDFEIIIRDADGDGIVDPAGLTAVASKDGAAQAAISTPVVVSAGSKMVKVALTLAEATADRIAIVVSSTSTGAKDAFAIIFTETSQIRDQATSAALATVQTDTDDIQARLPAALVSGRMDSDVGAKTGNVALSAQEKLDVNTEADTALANYDGPTNAEMIARTVLSADYFDPALDTVANVATVATLTGHTAQSADHAANISTLLSRIIGTLAAGTHNPATAAQIAVLSDWINNGRLDLILDAVLLDTGTTLNTKINDIQGGTFTTATDSLEAIRNRGDAAWVTGAGGASTWDPTEKENIRSALGVTGTKTTATGGQLQTIDTVADGIQADLSNATDGLGALKTGIDAIPTTPMRGTNNVPLNPALDTVYTAARAAKLDEITPARLSELDAATSGKMANQVDLVKSRTDTIPVPIKKNTAFLNYKFVMVDAADNPLTGLTVTATRVIDSGVFAAAANPVVEIASGAYRLDWDASDVNGNSIMFKFSAAGAKDLFVSVVTNP